MAKAKKRKTKVKKAKRAVAARKTKTKKGKRPVKKAVKKTKTVRRSAKKPAAKKAAPAKAKTYKILLMGASYGSLLASKIAVRRALDPSRVPAGRSRSDQRRRLQGSLAGARP